MFRTASNPRSILKHQSASYHATPSSSQSTSDASRPPCAVRFPSSPKISTIHFTHCASSYDRRPIVVLPNSCELPDRGCRDYNSAVGVSTSPHLAQTGLPQAWGNHVHPSVFGRMCSGSSEDEGSSGGRRLSSSSLEDHDLAYGWYSAQPPALTHDDASSEESDGIASPPPEQHAQANARAAHYLPPSQSHLHSEPLSHPPIPDCYGRTSAVAADPFSFLPHAPSTPQKKRSSSEKKRSSLEAASKRISSSAGSFCWASTTEEDSCLGGF